MGVTEELGEKHFRGHRGSADPTASCERGGMRRVSGGYSIQGEVGGAAGHLYNGTTSSIRGKRWRVINGGPG